MGYMKPKKARKKLEARIRHYEDIKSRGTRNGSDKSYQNVPGRQKA